jgi:hypothetical protein
MWRYLIIGMFAMGIACISELFSGHPNGSVSTIVRSALVYVDLVMGTLRED